MLGAGVARHEAGRQPVLALILIPSTAIHAGGVFIGAPSATTGSGYPRTFR